MRLSEYAAAVLALIAAEGDLELYVAAEDGVYPVTAGPRVARVGVVPQPFNREYLDYQNEADLPGLRESLPGIEALYTPEANAATWASLTPQLQESWGGREEFERRMTETARYHRLRVEALEALPKAAML